ncbi:MAG: hypothetical protein CMK53_05885 [Proteobacteria bacterium]|nr:hypothetical protein [Pseudomonadota bacterium]
MYHLILKTLILLLACVLLSFQGNLILAQGTNFFTVPEKKKVTPPKKSFQTKSPPETSSSSKAQTEAEAGGGEKT